MPIPLWLDLFLLILVVSAAVTDLAIRKIPNLFLLIAWCAAIGLHLCDTAPAASIGDALSGAAIGFGLFLPLYLVRGMAAGDVKLMATVGLFLGPTNIIEACVLTWCAGGVMALTVLLFTRRWAHVYVNLRSMLWSRLLGLGPPTADNTLARPSAGAIPYGLAIAMTTLWLLAQRHLP